MLSVTKRISNVQQPKSGYIPPKALTAEMYYDDMKINRINSAHKAIQGMAVDYLTRYVNGTPKHIAFKISLMGAKNVDELDNAKRLLSQINGLDSTSICAACQLVGYDVAYRRGPRFFSPVEKIIPNDKMIANIIVLVKRSITFLKKNGPVVLDGFTFEGGYNGIISSGDGDYLTADTLWDFKVSKSKPEKNQTLQILIYYILGIHSIHQEFQHIKKLGLFNPESNIAYTISLSDISDDVFQSVSRDVIGYCTPDDAKQWRTASGTNKKVLNEVKSYFSYLLKDTGFSPDNYDDGIYDITVDDYWSYYKKISDSPRPKFTRTHSIKFIKNSGYFMFVSVAEKGTTCLLQGGSLRSLKKPLQYYYDRLPEYATIILQKFSKYWDALYSISKQIQTVAFDEEEMKKEYEKYISECKEQHIESLDFDLWGRYKGNAYKNIPSLIATQRPEMLLAFNRAIEENTDKESTALVLADSKEKRTLPVLEKHEIDAYNELVTDTSIYGISNRMKALQEIYDHGLIVVWYDNILPHYELEEESNQSQSLNIGETKLMDCGMIATVLSDNGYKSITIQFEDGTIVKNCRRDKFREGKIKKPSPKQKSAIPQPKISYVGKTKTMNCGMNATVIEDFGCNNITVQFEDGFIKKNCRRDKFREGKIGHRI